MKKGLEYFVIAGMIILVASVYIHEMVHVWQFKSVFGIDSIIKFGNHYDNRTNILLSSVAYTESLNWDSKYNIEYNKSLLNWEIQAHAVQLLFIIGSAYFLRKEGLI